MSELTPEQVKLLEQNKIIPVGCPTDQINFFVEVCRRKKLDPFMRHIHLVERKSKDQFGKWITSYTIQAGIDGMRAIAQRNAKIKSYKRWVEKREDDLYGICEIDTEDRGIYRDELPFNEYVQKKGDGTINTFWAKFPQTMIKKCAEESVLRMMTPEDLSGVYGDDEMMQADSEPKEVKLLQEPEKRSTRDFVVETKDIETKEQFEAWVATLILEEDKKDAKGIKEAVHNRLFKANLDKVIANIKSNTPDKTLFAVESTLDDMEAGSKKDDLIRAYNEMCEKRGLDHKYEPLPFDR